MAITVEPIIHESVEGDIHKMEQIEAKATLTLADVETTLSLVLNGQSLHEFNTALQRALNTWESPPQWLSELSDLIDAHHIKNRRESIKTS
jgi:hypothetical protein